MIATEEQTSQHATNSRTPDKLDMNSRKNIMKNMYSQSKRNQGSDSAYTDIPEWKVKFQQSKVQESISQKFWLSLWQLLQSLAISISSWQVIVFHFQSSVGLFSVSSLGWPLLISLVDSFTGLPTLGSLSRCLSSGQSKKSMNYFI